VAKWTSKHAGPYRAPEVVAAAEAQDPTLPHQRKRWSSDLGRYVTWQEVHGIADLPGADATSAGNEYEED
jgi:hypothetical protein